jgi:hypothetical protein
MLIALVSAPAFLGISHAQIDSGGGIAGVGNAKNHSSIGAPFETVGKTTGLIEILYPPAPTLDLGQDSNSNGFPDLWEIQHFGSTGTFPMDDADGDGTTNMMEYLAGTDPRSAGSAFRPASEIAGSDLVMKLPTVAGRTYRIWGSPNLKSGWTLRDTFEGDGSLLELRYAMAQTPAGYFLRIEIVIPQ